MVRNYSVKSIKKFSDYSQFYNGKYTYNSSIIYSPIKKHSFLKYVVLTLSNPCNNQNRNIHRKIRKNYYKNILFVYVIGYSKYDNIIYNENKLYGDILLLKLRNHYFNITNIFLEAINWVNNRYHYDYLIKWDDDIIVNIPLLFIFSNLQDKQLHYSGYLYNSTRICRDKNKICYIPSNIYHYSFLPSFVASGLLILSSETSIKINYYHKIYKSYMIRDDQYIGVLCQKLSIKPIPINRYYARIKEKKGKINIKHLLAYHTNSFYILNKLSFNIFK